MMFAVIVSGPEIVEGSSSTFITSGRMRGQGVRDRNPGTRLSAHHFRKCSEDQQVTDDLSGQGVFRDIGKGARSIGVGRERGARGDRTRVGARTRPVWAAMSGPRCRLRNTRAKQKMRRRPAEDISRGRRPESVSKVDWRLAEQFQRPTPSDLDWPVQEFWPSLAPRLAT